MKLKKLMLSDIKGSVYQPRSQDDLELQGLEESILRNELICPIIVRQYRNSYKIVCGNRRYEALRIIQTNRHPLSLPEGAASIDKDGMVSTLCLVLPSDGKVIPIHTEKPELFHALSPNTCLPECGRDVEG